MGFFKSSKKKVSPAPSLPSQLAALVGPSPRLPSSPTVPADPPIPSSPPLRLRVAVHSASTGSSEGNEVFWIEVDPEEGVQSIRRVISDRLGWVAVGIFKVAIPIDAYENTVEYARRYKDRVDLISHFPAFCLEDPDQLRASLGPAGWQAQLPPSLRIKDWWPSPLTNGDIISILARPITYASVPTRPLTLLAHFAPTDPHSSSSYSSSPSGSPSFTGKPRRRPPTPVDILPGASIGQLKAALLHADGRSVDKLDKVVLWRVEMSEEEMVVIEERGGLKSGQMPWPYPPTAEVPVAISNDSLPVSHYFPDVYSNTRIVSLSVWIHPSAAHTLARILPPDALDAPPFKYPMVFPPEIRRASASYSLPADSPPMNAEIALTANTLPARVAGRARRARPSTAPAACDSPNSSPTTTPTFGGGLKSLHARSPLAKPPVHQTDVKGLGIAGSPLPPISTQSAEGTTVAADMERLSLKVDVVEPHNPTETEMGRIIWQPAEGKLRPSETQSKGIRSLANKKSLRAYEIC